MPDDRKCSECGRPFPEGATGSVCPRCLLKRGLEAADNSALEPRPGRDRNLLFGVIAIQLGFVSKEAFVEAAAAWAIDPRQEVADLLIRFNALSSEQRRLVDGLVDRAIELHGGDEHAALDSVDGAATASQIISLAADPTTGHHLSTALGLPRYVDGDVPEEVMALDERPGRYTKRSEYSRGGMGRILIVHDEFLSRDIALKELLPPEVRGADDERKPQTPVRASSAYVARFLREAKVTGQLEHPSIVPVYELGRRPDGTLYYTMKLVRGQTLKKALDAATTLENRLELLSNFVDLCFAVAYAHSRGVIHRDLKPANIMLGGFGETVVIDWGLAKIVDREDDQAEAIRKTIELMRGEPIQDLAKSQTGLRIGTPSYMAPEQVEGKINELDARTDVFALGVVLYEILTGRIPFDGKTTADVMDRILHDVPKPIRELEPDAPPELVNICDKAIRKDPDERYQSAEALAKDIRRFQTGALVHAHSYTPAEILIRFYRRNRAVLNTAAAALVILLTLGVYSYISIRQARDEAVIARDDAVDARQREAEARERAEYNSYVRSIQLARSYMGERNFDEANRILTEIGPPRRNWEWGYLVNASNDFDASVDAHDEPIVSAKYSPDGSRVFTAAGRGTVKMWDAVSHDLLAEMAEPRYRIAALAVNVDGSVVGVATTGEAPLIWRTESNEVVELEGHTALIRSISIDAAGNRMITGSEDRTAIIWDIQTATPAATLEGHNGAVQFVRFFPAGDRVVTGTPYGENRLWSLADVQAPVLEETAITGIDPRISPNGRYVATRDGTAAHIWSGTDGAPVYSVDGHVDSITDLAFTNDSEGLLTSSLDSTISLWNVVSGERLATFRHDDAVTHVAVQPLGNRFAAVSADAAVRLWSLDNQYVSTTRAGHSDVVTSIVFHPDGSQFLTAGNDGTFKEWSGARAYASAVVAYGPTGNHALAVSPGDTQIAVIRQDDGVSVVDRDTREITARFEAATVVGQAGLAFSPDGARIVATADRFTPIVWNLADGAMVSTFTGHAGAVSSVAFNQDGSSVISGSWDNTARIWESGSGEETLVLSGHEGTVNSAQFHPNGALAVTASDDGTAILWRLPEGAEERRITDDGSPIHVAGFSPDGSSVVLASSSGRATLWDLDGSGPRIVFEGHTNSVRDATFNNDGTRLVTASVDGSIAVWDTRTAERLLSLSQSAFGITAARFSRDGYSIWTASTDGAVREWNAVDWRTAPAQPDLTAYLQDERQRRTTGQGDPSELEDSAVRHLVATQEIVESRLQRLLAALAAREPATDAGGAIDLSAEGYGAHLLPIRFQSGELLTSLDGLTANSYETAMETIPNILGRLDSFRTEGLRLDTTLDGTERTRTVRFVEPVTHTYEMKILRQQAQSAIDRQLSSFRLNRRLIVRTANRMAALLGAPESSDGVWILGTPANAFKDFYLEQHIAPWDRIAAVNNEPITSLDSLLTQFSRYSETLSQGEAIEMTQHLERGAFQRLEIRLGVDAAN